MVARRLTVGLVAPDDGATEQVAEALGTHAFDVEIADDVSTVEAMVQERTIDCVVVDHRDSVNAVDLLDALEAADPLVPTVAFPTDGSEELAARLVYADVDGYVPRSDGVEALVAAIERIANDDDGYQDAEGMLDALLSMVPRSLSIYFKDTAGRHVTVTEDFPSLIGPPYFETPDGRILHRGADVVGKTDFDLYPTFLAEKTVEDEARIMRNDEPMIGELERSKEADGSEIFVSTSKAPWHDSTGRLRGIVGVTMDVTEQEKQRRALERQNDRLEQFASVLSHDLRNPLGIAKGRVGELSGDAEAKEDVVWALDRMDELITDVLELARQGSIVHETEPVHVAEPARAAWDTIDGGAGLELGDLPTADGDPERLRALFENLFRNAVQHGGNDVRVRVDRHESGFVVSDDGPGIPSEDRDSIFEHGYTTADDGTGFGLSIVREIVEAHGWEISLAADDGDGARFVVATR